MPPKSNKDAPAEYIQDMFTKMNLHTMSKRFDTFSNRFDDLRNEIRTLEDWCQNTINDLDERTATAFATSVDMIDKVEERIDEVEQEQEDQKRVTEGNTNDIKELKEAIE